MAIDAVTLRVPQLLAELAYFLTRRRQLEAAEVLVTGLRQLQPHHVATSIVEGVLHVAKDDLVGAEKSYRAALKVEPENELASTFLAECLLLQRRHREAEPIIKKILQKGENAAAVTFAQELIEGVKSSFQAATARSR
jgi:Flp pilus assembly protein TadD